jgi:hypothetical protein
MSKAKNVDVVCGYKVNIVEGATVRLWGVTFTCDGERYGASLPAEEAEAMIEAERVVKA